MAKFWNARGVVLGLAAVAIMTIGLAVTRAGGDEAPEAAPGAGDEAKPSSYAPAKDLEGQLTAFIEQTEEALAEESEFAEEQKATVARNAATFAAIGLVLGMHDEENPLGPAASGLIAAAEKLSAGAEDYAAAKAALDEIKTLVESPPERSEQKLEWAPAGDLAQHMKQVPIVNNNLRLGVTGRRFDRTIDRNAGLASTLAALAQVSMADTTYCTDPESEVEWRKTCAEMRDAAGDVQKAVRMKDQAAATKSLDAIVVTCDECHNKFRD